MTIEKFDYNRTEWYLSLCKQKRNGQTLTSADEKFIQDYAWERLQKILEEPEIVEVMKREG